MSDTPKTDAAARRMVDGGAVNEPVVTVVPVDFARAQERRILELIDTLQRCEMWFSVHAEGKKMRDVCRATIRKNHP